MPSGARDGRANDRASDALDIGLTQKHLRLTRSESLCHERGSGVKRSAQLIIDIMDAEIARRLESLEDLMRQRLDLEVQREVRRADERKEALARMEEFKLEMPKFEMSKPDGPDEFTAKLDTQIAQDRAERQDFQERLLGEIKRHNDLLETILKRITNT